MEVVRDSGGGEDYGWTDGRRWEGRVDTTLEQQTGMGISRKLEGFSWGKGTEVGEDGKLGVRRGQMSSVSLPTCKLPVIQFEAAEWVGAVEEHVPFRVD